MNVNVTVNTLYNEKDINDIKVENFYQLSEVLNKIVKDAEEKPSSLVVVISI